MRIARLLLLVAVLAACGGGGTSQPLEPSVPWSDYAPDVKTRIDGLAASRNCAGLQDEFDTADANNPVTLNRTGHNNAALMDYIDFKLGLPAAMNEATETLVEGQVARLVRAASREVWAMLTLRNGRACVCL